jgi:predicted Fe-Mo cluster-binding NifX family protein
MNIAIPIHGNRVMPRFGYTREIIVVTVEDGRIVSRKRVKITWQTFLSLLASERVSALICGGIHPRFQEMIERQNIQLVWGVIGEWQDVLQAYLDGTLQTNPSFCLQHGSRRGHCLRKGRQGGDQYASL